MPPDSLKFVNPNCSGIYFILVSGNVSNELTEYFDGIAINKLANAEKGVVESELILEAHDQAELIGLINMLYNWRHVLLNIRLDVKDAAEY